MKLSTLEFLFIEVRLEKILKTIILGKWIGVHMTACFYEEHGNYGVAMGWTDMQVIYLLTC